MKDLWSRRFHGWQWLLLPALAAALLALLAGFLLLGVLLLLVSGAIGILGLWKIGRAQADLRLALRSLVNGRTEARAAEDWRGSTGELAAQINALARRLGQVRDEREAGAQQANTRLRQEHERLQEQNNELRRSLRESLDSARMQSELFSNLSHELRTPLTAVLGYADLLRKSGLGPEQEQHLATLDRSARGMLTMINDLLDWSRIEAGKLRLHTDSFDVLAAVEETTALLAPLAYEKELELVRVVYHDVPRRLLGDTQRLRQIITNLVSNAIKFTPRGEVVVRVMREREEGERLWLRFAVSDTGIGIEADQQRALFQPFQQAGRSSGGSGLGLSITRRLADLMGGRVDLDSAPQRGSVFSVLLPFATVPATDPPVPSDIRLRERVVWVLEPQATARLALVHWLEFWGLRVTLLSSGQDLLQKLAQAGAATRPALLIIGAGAAAAREPAWLELTRSAAAQAPVLVMLASASLDLQARILDNGAHGCIPKSASHESLQTQLLRLTGAAPQSPRLGGLSILVADNNLPNRRYIAALCAELGLKVLEAEDGAQALRLWEDRSPQFVLLDARMPVMNGVECAREIRARETDNGRPPSRIFAISAHLEPEERREFSQAGADGILLKPFDGTQLAELLGSGSRPRPSMAAALLASDPSMLQLLLEELPPQYQQLEAAISAGDVGVAREAAHQLHGTASFYHLGALKTACATLESELARQPGCGHCRELLDTVRANLDDTLRDIRSRMAES